MKNLLPYLPVIVLAFTLIGGWFRLNADTSFNKEEIKVIKADVKELANEGDKEIDKIKSDTKKEIDELRKENVELDKAVIAQTVKLENIEILLEKIDKKLEKKK